MQVQMKISTIAQITDVTDCLLQQLRQWNIGEEKQMDIRLCIMEAVQNALLYGCPQNQNNAGVEICWQCTPQGFSFTVTDEGPGVPKSLQHQTWDRISLEEHALEEHGRGLLLMQAILDEVTFNETGNSLSGWLRW